jgi:O-acetyl-ADP-ribose deacetylase (regulator of RNase III)
MGEFINNVERGFTMNHYQNPLDNITFASGNILDSKAQALVNTVNCVGVMGKGLALQFKTRFPDNYLDYKRACDLGLVTPGKMHIHHAPVGQQPLYIFNFPTKRHWRDNSRIEDIDSGMLDLVKQIKDRGITSIAIPPLGCGLGGLDWGRVLPIILNNLRHLHDVNVKVYQPK